MKGADPRLTPARPDLAAAHLQGRVAAARFVDGSPAHCISGCADLRRAPSHEAGLDTQILYGEDVVIYDERDGWAWVQLVRDSYVGYLASAALARGEINPTHRISVMRSFIYSRPDIKAPVCAALPLGALVRIIETEGAFCRLAEGGFVFAHHLMRGSTKAPDFVAVAESLLGVPYLWGGKSPLGLDCSGLVQLALQQAGIASPRDTDMQESTLGRPAAPDALQRGDLVFWRGHVGIMRDQATLLHANAHHMLVASESLAEACTRIRANGGGELSAIRRL